MIAPLLLLAAALQTTDVTEPNTKVKFATELQTASGPQLLAGTGIRTRTMLKVKVYAFGLYVDAAGARAGLGAWRGKKAADLARDRSLYNELLKGGFPHDAPSRDDARRGRRPDGCGVRRGARAPRGAGGAAAAA